MQHTLPSTTHDIPLSILPGKDWQTLEEQIERMVQDGHPLRVRYCLGMLAFILEPVPPASRTKPTSDRSVSAVGKDSSLPSAASDVEEEVAVAALCFDSCDVDAEIDDTDDGRAATPSDCVNAYDVGVAARAAAAASVVDAQIFILMLHFCVE